MAALLHDVAVVEHDDVVGVDDGGEPVGDDDRRAPLEGAGERLLHERLEDPANDSVWKLLEGRIPADDQALTILGLPSD